MHNSPNGSMVHSLRHSTANQTVGTLFPMRIFNLSKSVAWIWKNINKINIVALSDRKQKIGGKLKQNRYGSLTIICIYLFIVYNSNSDSGLFQTLHYIQNLV